MIQEEEELERLAGLQLRESLVRGMGVSEQVRVALESQPSSRAVTPSGPPVRANCESAENPHYFTQTYLHQDLPEHLPSSVDYSTTVGASTRRPVQSVPGKKVSTVRGRKVLRQVLMQVGLCEVVRVFSALTVRSDWRTGWCHCPRTRLRLQSYSDLLRDTHSSHQGLSQLETSQPYQLFLFLYHLW